jgi:hypothetical protein
MVIAAQERAPRRQRFRTRCALWAEGAMPPTGGRDRGGEQNDLPESAAEGGDEREGAGLYMRYSAKEAERLASSARRPSFSTASAFGARTG